MAGDPAAGVGGNAHPASGSKSSRSSTRHRQFRDRAKVRVDDLQEMFCGLQSARKESRSADAAVLEEQVHQMLREWRAELSVPSPASSLQNSQGNNREASDPPSDTLRLLQLAVPEEEDDASSKLLVPPSRQTHEHGQDSRMANTDQQCEAIDGGTAPAQHSLGQGVDGDCGEVSSVANAMFNHRMYYTDYELNIDDFLCGDGYEINISGSNEDQFNNLHGIGQLGHQQFDLPLDLPPTHSYADANNSEQNTGDVFVHMSDLLTTIWPSPSQYLGPKCALWDCGRPAGGTEDSGDYCNPYHAGLALNDDGLLGIRPVMRPRGIDLKDGPLFAALIAKVQGKNVGIPVCGGAATSKSPWNAPELFDLSLLEGESLREWLFFDTPRRAFESGNRKQRSLPDYGGRGWHESRKLVMKDFAGLKRSYYMDPQPSSSHEWHLFEYEINASDALALYRLEYKSSDPKRVLLSQNWLVHRMKSGSEWAGRLQTALWKTSGLLGASQRLTRTRRIPMQIPVHMLTLPIKLMLQMLIRQRSRSTKWHFSMETLFMDLTFHILKASSMDLIFHILKTLSTDLIFHILKTSSMDLTFHRDTQPKEAASFGTQVTGLEDAGSIMCLLMHCMALIKQKPLTSSTKLGLSSLALHISKFQMVGFCTGAWQVGVFEFGNAEVYLHKLCIISPVSKLPIWMEISLLYQQPVAAWVCWIGVLSSLSRFYSRPFHFMCLFIREKPVKLDWIY
uniref:Expressed protein DH12 n=1 Tax=Zea mays TaxID=4577 RepID=Q5XQF4_MAIZE|nr:expressed protein DH12 [Zea mays]